MTAATDRTIRTRGMGKRYGSSWAVRDLDLDVHRGEVFALLGPNGAGKTTAVEILEGFRRRSEGEAQVLGVDPAHADAAWRARVGVVPQATGAFDDLTVAETVAHFASFYPAPLRPEEAIDIVGLTDQRNTRCARMSGGQKRKLDVALGIVGDPELIFLDEPTTGLDPVARRQAWDLVRSFAARGRTTVLTTHYLEEAEELADRAGIIVGGVLVEVGAVADLGDRSATPSAVGFRRAGALSAAPLPPLPAGATVDVDQVRTDGIVEIRTRTPTALLATLMSWASTAGVTELHALNVRAPTLEDVYLALIQAGDGDGAGRADGHAGVAA